MNGRPDVGAQWVRSAEIWDTARIAWTETLCAEAGKVNVFKKNRILGRHSFPDGQDDQEFVDVMAPCTDVNLARRR